MRQAEATAPELRPKGKAVFRVKENESPSYGGNKGGTALTGVLFTGRFYF